MKRYRSTLLGVSLTALAVMIIAVGCSSSNPVAPQTSGIQYENTDYTDQLIMGEGDFPPVIDGGRDNRTGAITRSTPEIVEFDRDNPPVVIDTPVDNLRITRSTPYIVEFDRDNPPVINDTPVDNLRITKSTPYIVEFDRDNPPVVNGTPVENLRIE